MAGTTTKVGWASFIPAIWAQRVLNQLRGNIILARLVSRDFEDEIKDVGDTVRIGKIGVLTAVDKAAGTAVTRQNPAATHLDLVLDKHKVVPFTIEDVARAQSNPQAMDAQIAEAARALGEQVESDIFASMIANAGSTVGTGGTVADEALVLLIRKALADGKAPQQSTKSCVWGTADTNALLATGSGRFSSAYIRGDQGEALREGALGRFYGMDHYESQFVPTSGTAPVITQGVAFASAGVQMAVRPLPPPPEGVGAKGSVVSDPISGLSLRLTSQYDIDNIGLATNLEILYGLAVVRPEWVVYAKT